MGDLSCDFYSRLSDFGCLGVEVVDEILASLEALGGKRPEKSACAYLVKLDHVVIDKALVYIFNALKDNAFFGPNFFYLFKIKYLLSFVVDVENSFTLFIQRQSFFAHLTFLLNLSFK